MTLGELAERIREREAPDHEGTTEAIETALEERHLPKLIEAHVIDYDDRTDTVRYCGQPSLEKWIEHAEFEEGTRPEE